MNFDPVIRLYNVVQKQPNHISIVDYDKEITYKMFFILSYSISQLIKLNTNQTTPRVLIYLSKSIEAYAAMFGTLISGGYYSPLNVDASSNTKSHIIKLFTPHIIITSANLSKEVNDFVDKFSLPSKITIIDKISEQVANGDIVLNEQEIDFDLNSHDKGINYKQLAYVIFTSGSTGIPKGVMISRDALAHYTNWAVSAIMPSDTDRWAQYANISFDLSVLDIFGALCSGATLYLVSKKIDEILFGNFIRRNKISIVNIVPSVTDLLIQSKQIINSNLHTVRLINYCGEPLMQYHIEAMFSVNPSLQINNTYGPTECTVSCTLLRLDNENYKNYCYQSVALGDVIPGMDLSLTQETDGNGEIILSGEQVAEGYWQDKEGTRKSFYKKEINGKIVSCYKTGDWARYENDRLYFVGRKDEQYKIQGYRVELGSINAHIYQLIKMNVSTLFYDGQLHCFIERKDIYKLDFEKILQKLRANLINYELPNNLYSIKCLPRNNNNKVDKKALLVIARNHSNSKESCVHL